MKMVILVRLIFRWNSKAQHLSDPIIITKCDDQANNFQIILILLLL